MPTRLGNTTIDNFEPISTVQAGKISPVVDLRELVGETKFVADLLIIAGTSATLDVTLEESDDGVTGWSPVDGGVYAQVAGAVPVSSHQVLTLKADALKRYIRANIVVGGSSPLMVVSLSYVGNKKSR